MPGLKTPNIRIGQEFGRLTVIGLPTRKPDAAGTRMRWFVNCRCVCGKMVEPDSHNLESGNTESCGCLFRERASESAKLTQTIHGFSATKLGWVWGGMVSRCEKPSAINYHRYGGRGICICPEWRDDFLNFKSWAESNGYAEGLMIERIDNDGNYEPSNCRWATRTEQARNTSRTRFETAFGETRCLPEWLEDPRCVVNRDALKARMSRGWDFESALTTPLRPIAEIKTNEAL